MLICNGSYKTGTHALLKTLYLFGGDGKLAIHKHKPYANRESGHRYINIFRSPRNVVGSWIKFTDQELNEATLIKNIPDRIKEMFEYVEWYTCKDETVLNIKYEELLTDPKVIDDIAKFLGLNKEEDHFRKMWGGTYTFTGTPFIWRDHWSESLEKTWVDNGGLILENALDYDPDKVWIRKKQ